MPLAQLVLVVTIATAGAIASGPLCPTNAAGQEPGAESEKVSDDETDGEAGARAEEVKFSAEDLEFFEKKIRPILAARCYECHSGRAKKLQGGLRVDSRDALLAGGDTGPAVVVGEPDDSLLIDAIRYGEYYQMPPKSKMPQAEIDLLTAWVKRGAPWPAERVEPAGGTQEQFDLLARREAHWCWLPIAKPSIPAVADVRGKSWPNNDIDRFILARLQQQGLEPAAQAPPAALLRRVYFDLIGLPPTPEQLEAFLNDQSPNAYQKVVDELLESPHFAERWARHWLDLVRYAESRGHEFDYDTPNAFEYRDYVIRAIDRDVPYDQFLIEHVAGDLVESPRQHESGFNESVLGTGFWFLGEWVHSPVDIRQDETDRFDNMIDVFSKTFMGLTVACARCHDHKFDAIAQRDYYALAGYLQSSAYRQVRFETELQHRQLQSQVEALESRHAAEFSREFADAVAANKMLEQYLLSAASIVQRPDLLDDSAEDVVVEDFERNDFGDWEVSGSAFGTGPVASSEIAKYQGDVGASGRFVNSHNVKSADGVKHGDQFTGTLTSPPFEIERSSIVMLVGGGAHRDRTCVDLLIDGERVLSATGKNNNRMSEVRWDVSQWLGKTARIRIVDQVEGGWGNIGVDQIRQTDGEKDGIDVSRLSAAARQQIREQAAEYQLDPQRLSRWVVHLARARSDSSDLFHDLARNRATSPRSPANPEKGEPQDADVTPSFVYRFDGELMADGVSFGDDALPAETLVLADTPEQLFAGVATAPHAHRRSFWNSLRLAGGTARDAGRLGKWDRAGKVVRTPTMEQTEDDVLYYLVRGKGVAFAAVNSHRMLNGPLHGRLVKEFDTGGKWQWVDHDLRRYAGHDLHVEFSCVDALPLEVYDVRLQRAGERPQVPFDLAEAIRVATAGKTNSAAEVAQQLLGAWQREQPNDLVLRDWMVRHAELFVEPATLDRWRQSDYWQQRAALQQRVQPESRTALAIWDGDGRNERLLIRGNHKTPGPEAIRGNLAAFSGGPPSPPTGSGSGRLQLAQELATLDNPLTARVAANRMWAHLTGRGIVASTDNFGLLGQQPSHPELLDHLANRLVELGWSRKRLIREIVLSRTYQMSTDASDAGRKADPTNRLLHAMRIRRLEGEVIRDAIMAVSGRLDPQLYGHSVPVYLTPFMQGRGRPGSGPLDGGGRRSIYISIRRNFLSPMMLAFDTPQPFSTVGRRSSSNVPAQALILLNDPMVTEQAKRWAKRAIAAEPQDANSRLDYLFRQAFSRPIRDDERRLLADFVDALAEQNNLDSNAMLSSEEIWAEVCHTLFNMKEFVFVL